MTNNIKSLYIHIPFCSSICSYCDFYKMIATDKIKEKYINYLIKELNLKAKNLINLETIYIGGGTPSSLNPNLLEKLLNKLSQITNLSILKEFSIEANPNDINVEFLSLLNKYNVNRISLGVQSVLENKLNLLNRKHNLQTVIDSINLINDYGIPHVNVDYMFGLPNDTPESVLLELETITKLNIDHISCYSLILEEKTILYHKYLKDDFHVLDPDIEANLYYTICKYLNDLGFKQYEISNFCLNDNKSYHNLRYWNNEEYEAIGANASSYVEGIRKTNINNLNKYFIGIDNNNLIYSNYEILTQKDIIENEIMLGFRKIDGIDLDEFYKKFQIDFIEKYPITKELIKNKFLNIENNRLFISKDYLYISNEIILKYIS